VGKAIEEMKDRKSTRNEAVPGYVLKLLGEAGLRTMTADQQHVSNWRVTLEFH